MSENGLVEDLVKRIVTRLPAYATSLDTSFDSDPAIRQAGIALYDHSKRRLPLVLQPLLAELECLIRPPHYRPDTDFVSVDLLRSQLYLLLTITNCTTHYWVSSDTPERRARRPTPVSSPNPAAGPPPPTPFLDPPPLDDALAKQVLNICIFFLKQHSHASENTPSSSSTGESPNPSIASLTQAALSALATSDRTSARKSSKSSRAEGQDKTSPTTRPTVVQAILVAAERILYFLSASNWNVVFNRVKARISHYAASDELPDSSEMRILEWCCLDRRRLSTVIQELCNTFIHLKRPAQASMSVVLCRAIWSWIESFGAEFSALIIAGRRMEGGPEVLFDIIYTLSENSKRKTFAWPVMTLLLTCCPDILAKLAIGEGSRAAGLTKKVQFFESLKKAMKSPKLADVACACYTDLCRAATWTQPDPSDPSALRLLVSDLEFDLKSKLLDPSTPFLNSDGGPDLNLMTEALIALYRLDPTQVAARTFPPLLEASAPDSSKLTAVYALDVLLRENIISNDVPDNNSSNGSSRRGHQAASDEHSRRNELTRGILRVWMSDLRFLVFARNPAESNALRRALVGLLEEPNHSSVQTLAVATLSALSRSEAADVIVARDAATASAGYVPRRCRALVSLTKVGEILCPTRFSVNYAITRYVIESNHDPAQEKAALELELQELKRLLGHFSPPSSDRASALVGQPGWAALWTPLEIAVLLCLLSNQPETRRIALQCLQVSATLLDSAEATDPDLTPSTSNNTIRAFASEFLKRSITHPTQEDQRAVARVVFASLPEPTLGLVAGWDEAMRRWKELSAVIFSRVVDDDSDNGSDAIRREQMDSRKSPEHQFEEWSSLCSHLLAASGVCARPVETPRLDSIVPPECLPARFYSRVDRPRNIDRLIQELVDLLVSDSMQVRDVVRDALGSDLSPEHLHIFFKHLRSIVGHFFDNEKGIPVTEEAFTVFIEQTIAVLRLMFGRLDQPLADTAIGTLDSLLVSFTTYIQRLGFTAQAYELKIRLCHLCKTVFAQRDSQQHDSVLRNLLLEHFVGWASDSRPANVPVRNAHDTELRANTVEALSNLISTNVDPAYHQFAEMGASSDLSARSAYLETLVKVIEKGTTFDRLARAPNNDTFAQLINLIRQPDLTLAMALCEVCTASHYEDLTELFLKIYDTPKTIAKFLKAVIEMEVSVTDHESTLFRGNSFATRILTAYARARGYHYLRNTLKDLLLTLCKKPHEFSMDFDPHKQTAADDAASRNLEQVTEAFLVCICQSIDQVPAPIREICAHIAEVVKERFPESIFTAIGGFIFLRFINPAIVSPENIDLDLPSDNRDIRRGLLMITKVLQALANNVRFGAKEPGMRKLNDFMDVNIFGMTRFLQAISQFSGGDEALTSERDDVDAEEDTGLDETDKSFLHQFLHDNMDKLGMELLQGKPATFRHWHDGDEGFSPSIGPRTWERVTTLIASLGPPPETASRIAAEGWHAPEPAYAAFMARNEARMMSDGLVWSRVFYESSGNKSGLTTFVLLANRIKAETADLESLVFYVLQQLADAAGPFEILIDCTKFASANEVPTQWIVQLVAILPAPTAQNLSRVFIFGPNTLVKRYLRKLGRLMSFERLDSRKAIALSTVAELEQYFSRVELMLPSSTVALGRERWIMFNHITERHQIRVEHPVVFKIGQVHVLISTMKKQDLFSDVKCILEDVIDFSDIEEIRKVLLTEGDGISIRVSGDPALRTFLTNVRRDELLSVSSDQHVTPGTFRHLTRIPRVKALNTARNAAPMRATSASRDRHIAPEDVTAVLINSILLNLCSERSDLRAHAHDLLCSLALSYNLVGFEDLTRSPGAQLYLPDILHACISLAATGPPVVRSAVRGLLVNTVHSLGKDSSVDTAKLKSIGETITGPDAERLFELSPPTTGNHPSTPAWDVSESGVELVALMSEIINAGAPSTDAANSWRARWCGLSTANCFQHSPALQPRAYIVIGGIGLGHQLEIDSDLILTTLRSRIRLGSRNDGTLAAVIIQCLVKTLPGLAAEATFWHSLFWIAMSLLQIGNPKISAASIRLLAAVLEGLDARGHFKAQQSMEEVLLSMQPRENEAQGKYMAQLQQYSGVDFRQHMSFAIATLVVKNLHHESSEADTIDLLFKLLLCSRKIDDESTSSASNGDHHLRQVASSSIGYFLVLFPLMVRRHRLSELLFIAGLSDIDESGLSLVEKFANVAGRLRIVDDEQAFLSFALLSALARVVDTDEEHLAIFTILSHISSAYPNVSYYLFESVAPIINSVIATSDDFDVLDTAQALLQSQEGAPPSSERGDRNAALSQLGFAALTWEPVATYSPQDLLPGAVTAPQKELASVVTHLIADSLMNPPDSASQ
ncbi:neurofibromin 1, partial [Phenoliferia sp. Uapishka_3]